MEAKKKTRWMRGWGVAMVALLLLLLCAYLVWVFCAPGNPGDRRRIGEIPPPEGFVRDKAPEDSYTAFLRDLPLKGKGTVVHLFPGDTAARYQFLYDGVIDMPLLSNDEQCADVTMRIRAEYFWKTRQFDRIRFRDLGGRVYAYPTRMGARFLFKSFMKTVYQFCFTGSVYAETQPRSIRDVQPGDVLVYSSRKDGRMGHAVLVTDVARNKRGRVAILCIEGNTPARDIHIVRNLNPFRNPWFILREGQRTIRVGVSSFKRDELRYYPPVTPIDE